MSSEPDVTLPIDSLQNDLKAYALCKARQAKADAEALQWKEAAETVLTRITPYMEKRGANVGLIADRPVCKYSTWTEYRFDFKSYAAEHPTEAAALKEQYHTSADKSRFTIYKGGE